MNNEQSMRVGEGTLSKVELYSFFVEPFHVDFTGHLFLGVLGNHLLNAAGHHSHNRGWGIDQLNEAHFTWVLSRLCIELTETPAQYEHVEVETWVESVMKLFTERNFLIRNADDGRIYGYARSVWAMIDTTTRHPADLLLFKDGDIQRYLLTAEEKPCPIAKHGRVRLAADSPVREIAPCYGDIDINGHVNSVKYIEHILNLFPHEQFEQHRIRRFEIAYKAESYMGDSLAFFCEEHDGEHHVEIRKRQGESATLQGESETLLGESAKRPAEIVVQAKVIWE